MLAPEFLQAVVPLGSLTPDGAFVVRGAGVLLEHAGFAWLITLRSVRADAGGLIALGSSRDGEPFTLEIDDALNKHRLGWVESEDDPDFCAAPIPLSPDWRFRSIPKKLTVSQDMLRPSSRCYTVGISYELDHGEQEGSPKHLTLDGVIAAAEADEIYFTAPAIRGSQGGPLFVETGLERTNDAALLAGIVLDTVKIGTHSPPVPESDSAPFRLGRARTISTAFAVLVSAEGKAMTTRLENAAR